MLSLGCNTNCYRDYSFDRALQGLASAGLKYVEIDMRQIARLSGEDVSKPSEVAVDIVRRIKCFNLEPLCVYGQFNLLTESGLQNLTKCIDFACAIGVGIININAGPIADAEAEKAFLRLMKRVVRLLKERQMVIALETGSGILGTGKACMATLEKINSEQVMIDYNPANIIYFSGANPETDMVEIVRYIAHFQIEDKLEGRGIWNFPAVGDGYVNFNRLFGCLAKNGYKGSCSISMRFVEKGPGLPEEVDFAVQKSARYIGRIMTEIGQNSMKVAE